MPVISVDPDELLRLTDADQFDLIEALPKLGIEIEMMEDEEWELEIFPDRCDMLSVEGIARAVRGFLGIETGLVDYEVKESDIRTEVELSVQEVRPYIVTAHIKNVELTEPFLKSLMDVQEKLHLTLGRNREKVAIGIHDAEKIEAPFTYKAVKPEEVSFQPLQKRHEMTLKEILEKHEKGKEYAFVLEGKDRYPLITDKNDNVLSFPPIINGALTQLTEDSEELFIDMTGTDQKALEDALNIICSLFADRSAEIYSTTVAYGSKEKVYPDLSSEEMEINWEESKRLLGVDIGLEETAEILEKMRYSTSIIDDDTINVKIPAYRHDILHPYDIMEDLAIGYDFDNYEGVMPEDLTVGKGLKSKKVENAVADILVGYGFQEVMNSILSNPEKEFVKMGFEKEDDFAVVENPVSEEHTCLRVRLLPTLLNNLRKNRNKSLPQKLFEIGDVFKEGMQKTKTSGVMIHSEAGFTETKSIIEGLMKDIGLDFDVEVEEHPSFIDGRCASIITDGTKIGLFGEVHPKVLNNFGLEYPTTAFEIDMDKVFDLKI